MSPFTRADARVSHLFMDAVHELDLPSPDDVYAALHDAGVTGERKNCKTCPVARFLSSRVGMLVSVGVERAGVCGYIDANCRLPDAVTEMILRFDRGDSCYADLYAPAGRRLACAPAPAEAPAHPPQHVARDRRLP